MYKGETGRDEQILKEDLLIEYLGKEFLFDNLMKWLDCDTCVEFLDDIARDYDIDFEEDDEEDEDEDDEEPDLNDIFGPI